MRINLIVFLTVVVVGCALSVPITPAAAQNACIFTPSAEGAQLYHAPLTDPSQQRALLTLGTGYRVERQHGEHYFITLDGVNGGWVDRRSGGVSGDCGSIPVDNTPLSAFPTVCTITITETVMFYGDAALTEPRFTLTAGTYVVIQQADPVGADARFHVALGHAMSGWIAGQRDQLSVNCGGVPVRLPAVRALADARVWSAPDVQTGEVLYTLAEGTPVVIVQGPVTGPIRYDTADVGNWYQVAVGSQVPGWVWEARLDMVPAPAPEPEPDAATALTLENARLWSAPNVQTGSITAYLPPELSVTIVTGPVTGPIRYDTLDQGQWYYVQPAGGWLPGWIWAERLAQ